MYKLLLLLLNIVKEFSALRSRRQRSTMYIYIYIIYYIDNNK